MGALKKYLFFTVLLFSICNLLFSQSKKIDKDSFRKKAKVNDVSKLLIEAEKHSLTNPTKALDYVAQALSISIKENDTEAEGDSYRTLGKINFQQGLYSKSIENFKKAISIFQVLKNQPAQYEVKKLLAPALEENKEYKEALEIWEFILREAELSLLQSDIVVAKSGIARVYEKDGQLEKALINQQEVLKIEEKRGNTKGVISANNKIGDIYYKQDKNDQALSHYSKSEEVAKKIDDAHDLVFSNDLMAKVYRKEKKFDEELALRMKSISLKKNNNDKEGLIDEYLDVSRIYIEQQNASEAIPFVNHSIRLSEQIGKLDKKSEGYRILSEIYNKQGNLGQAVKSYKTYVILMDSLYKQKEKSLAGILNFNEELGDRQKKIESLEKDQLLNSKTIELLRKEQKLKEESMKKQAVIIYSLIAGLILVFGASYLLYKSSQKRRLANQLLALKSLRSQMNPHFIFNALNSVNSFISQNDERSANKYLSEFSKLMRSVMENSQYDFVPLSSELRILELYLGLEHFRFKEKFDYVFEVDAALDSDFISVPPMLIQPYIENAVWHGLRYKEEKGFLFVKVDKVGEELKVLIEDNGIGRKKSQELKTHNQKETISTGLRNIESRIKIINEVHKTKLSVQIQDLNFEAPTGTKVIITIPLQVKEPIIA